MTASSDDLRYEAGAEVEKSSTGEKEDFKLDTGEAGRTLEPDLDDHDV
jgi:hypothetical protein